MLVMLAALISLIPSVIATFLLLRLHKAIGRLEKTMR